MCCIATLFRILKPALCVMQVLPWILDVGYTIMCVAIMLALMGHILFGDFEITMVTIGNSISGVHSSLALTLPTWPHSPAWVQHAQNILQYGLSMHTTFSSISSACTQHSPAWVQHAHNSLQHGFSMHTIFSSVSSACTQHSPAWVQHAHNILQYKFSMHTTFSSVSSACTQHSPV